MGVATVAMLVAGAALAGAAFGGVGNGGGIGGGNGGIHAPVAGPSDGGVADTAKLMTRVTVHWGANTNDSVFAISHFAVGVEAATSFSGGGGASVGKPQFSGLSLERAIDSASPKFLKMISTGVSLDRIVVELYTVNKTGNETPYLKYTFDNVFVTKIDWSGPGDEGPEESITFVYAKISLSHFVRDPSTGTLVESQFGLDIQKGTAWTP